MRPTLAVIDIDIFSGQDELVREQLLENLHLSRRGRDTAVAQLAARARICAWCAWWKTWNNSMIFW